MLNLPEHHNSLYVYSSICSWVCHSHLLKIKQLGEKILDFNFQLLKTLILFIEQAVLSIDNKIHSLTSQ